ncbi:UNVERIFIED_CONTAM: hypothetical protein FKN15_049570 [Acipenser sinensis]
MLKEMLTQSSSFSQFQYVAIGLSGVVLLAIVIVAAVWYNRYRKLSQTIEEMRRTRVFIDSEDETPIRPSPDDSQPTQEPPAHLECSGAAARPLWSPPVQLPYSELPSSEEVVFNICSGYRLQRPEKCRTQIFQVMTDCWREPPTLRPSFSDIVTCLENVIENDSDYVQVAAEDSDAVFNDRYRAAKGVIPCENEAE